MEKRDIKNNAVLAIHKKVLVHRKKISGYHRRLLAEMAMYQSKQLLVGKICLCNYNGQVGDVWRM